MKTVMFRPLIAAAATVALGLASAVHAQPTDGPPDRRGPPSPERMVEHAMTFDADGDGKLDRAELTKFAEEIHAMRMRGGPGGGDRGGKGGQAAGRGPGRRGPGGPPGDGERRPQPAE